VNAETAKPTPADVPDQLANIKLVSVDVDGVLTDGGIYYSDDGNTFRKFNAKDGMGLVMLRDAGIEVTIISAGRAGAIEHRAERLGITHVFTEAHDKKAIFEELCATLGIDPAETLHMGDDVNDLKLMALTGLSVAPADALDTVLQSVDIVTTRNGGRGAVRELCDAILSAQRKAG